MKDSWIGWFIVLWFFILPFSMGQDVADIVKGYHYELGVKIDA